MGIGQIRLVIRVYWWLAKCLWKVVSPVFERFISRRRKFVAGEWSDSEGKVILLAYKSLKMFRIGQFLVEDVGLDSATWVNFINDSAQMNLRSKWSVVKKVSDGELISFSDIELEQRFGAKLPDKYVLTFRREVVLSLLWQWAYAMQHARNGILGQLVILKKWDDFEIRAYQKSSAAPSEQA